MKMEASLCGLAGRYQHFGEKYLSHENGGIMFLRKFVCTYRSIQSYNLEDVH
jgi:hypothetical protein